MIDAILIPPSRETEPKETPHAYLLARDALNMLNCK